MTDYIVDRSPMIQDEFITKIADAVWALVSDRVKKEIDAASVEIDDDMIDNRIRDYISNVSVDDFGFDIDDYQYGIESIIDNHLSGKEVTITLDL